MNNNQGQYDIRLHTAVLTPSKGSKTKYHCPVCNGDDLDIKPSDGAYQCFSGGCDTKDIRLAIDALEGKPEWKPESKAVNRPSKSIRPKSRIHYEYPNRDGSKLVRVARIDDGKGGKPVRYQEHWDGFTWQKGVPSEVKPNIAIYRYAEVQQAILDDRLIFVVEGEPCVDALWKLDIPATTTIAGTAGFAANGDYTNDFDGGRFVLSPDCDAVGIKYIANFAALLGDKVHGYYLAGSNPDLWVDPAGGFDIKDDITDLNFDRDRILANVISADEYRKALNPVPPKPVGRPRKQQPTTLIDRDYQQLAQKLGIDLPELGCDADGIPLSKLVKLELDLLAMYGNRLEFNEMSCEIELDRRPIEMDATKSFIAESNLGDRTQQDCDIAIARIAKLHKYSPVREYLESLRGKGSKEFIENVPQKYWNNNDPLHNLLFFKKLIACVARVMQPGCEDHTLLILKGGQGAGKSSTLKALSGEEWFTDDLRSIDDKDELAKLSRFWVLELAEVDYLFGKKETTLFKRFLSGCKDTFRPPYGRSNVTKPRTSALFATTNQSEFLSDPTGARRYWVVDVGGDINIAQIKLDRDKIWAAAVAAYDEGIEWWLPKDLEIHHQQVNEQYQEHDIWGHLIGENISTITAFQGSIEYTNINLVADRILNLTTDKQDLRVRRRVAQILRTMGFEATNIRIDGKQVKVWGRSTVNATQVCDKSDSGNSGSSLKPLPVLSSTKDTQDTQVSLDNNKEKLNNENRNSEIINNYSCPIENNQVAVKSGNSNDKTVTESGIQDATQLLLKPGDRVWIAKYNENGTVEDVYRDTPPRPNTARVIRDSGGVASLDILPEHYRLI